HGSATAASPPSVRSTSRTPATRWSAPSASARSNPMLEIRNLTKRYRNIPVVNDVSFTLRPGEVTGYLGPNGSGKSTTVRVCAALIEPTAGRGLWGGPAHREERTGLRRRLGYVPEEAILYSYMPALE